MTLTFDPLPLADSPLRRLDPRWKLAALMLASAAVAALQTVSASALALVCALMLAAVGRLPRRWLLVRLGTVALFLTPFALILLFVFDDARGSFAVGPVPISIHGVDLALRLCCKALTIVSLMLVLLATTPLDALLQAAHALRVPGLLIQLAVLTYRYLFVLADELARLRIAVRVRGYRNRATLHSYRTVGHVAGTLLVRGHERAERVGQAMRCRGFDGRFRSLMSFGTTPADVIAFALIVGAALGLLVFDFRWSILDEIGSFLSIG
jgi:cobalt/nickel transport system permease protein